MSNNALTAGTGGTGAASGPGGGRNEVPGGAGGDGGDALGGGVYVSTDAEVNSVNNTTVSDATLEFNAVTSGTGGAGGQGGAGTASPPDEVGPGSAGGDAGLAAGGGVYIDSLNGANAGSLLIIASTLAGNSATSAPGGNAGTGNTGNGGDGGNGGKGGSAEGGGLYDGDNTDLTVVNTTIGGTSLSATSPDQFSNVLVAGNGGDGGSAGTAGNTLTVSSGGAGGAGGSILGAGVYVDTGPTTFLNDTIVNNVANLFLVPATPNSGEARRRRLRGDAEPSNAGVVGPRRRRR